MKRLFILIAAIMLLTTVCGCGKRDSSPKAPETGDIRAMHKCGLLFFQEWWGGEWRYLKSVEDPFMEHECDNPDCDCHMVNMVAYEQEEEKRTND